MMLFHTMMALLAPKNAYSVFTTHNFIPIFEISNSITLSSVFSVMFFYVNERTKKKLFPLIKKSKKKVNPYYVYKDLLTRVNNLKYCCSYNIFIIKF